MKNLIYKGKEENQTKVDNFLKELITNESVIKIAEYYKKNVDEICTKLQKYITINQFKTGEIKRISLDFLETGSNIKVIHINIYTK